MLETLPELFDYGSTVVLNDEIHFLDHYSHYKWDGTTWISVSTLPYDFYRGSAVVLNGEIHILGGGFPGGYLNGNKTSSIYSTYHYKWDGASWTSVSTLPYAFGDCPAVVYNNEIHLLGQRRQLSDGSSISNLKYHYKWDGTTWTSLPSLPYVPVNGTALVYNNELHLVGGNDSANVENADNKHCKWDGTTWTSLPNLPYQFAFGSAVVLNDEIHILGGSSERDVSRRYIHRAHYRWNGTTWRKERILPELFAFGSAVVWLGYIVIFLGNEAQREHSFENFINTTVILIDYPSYEMIVNQ